MGTGSGNTVLYSEILVKNQMSGVLALLRQVRWLKTCVQSQNLLEEKNKFLGGFLWFCMHSMAHRCPHPHVHMHNNNTNK